MPHHTGGNRQRGQPVDLGRALIEAFLTNERINQVLLEVLSPQVWRAQPPCAKWRNIATTFAHMHNVRCMRLKMSAADQDPPFRKKFYEEILPGLKAKDKVVICVTHDDRYFDIADRRLKMEFGRIVA